MYVNFHNYLLETDLIMSEQDLGRVIHILRM